MTVDRDAIARAHGWPSWDRVVEDSRRDAYTENGGRGPLTAAIGRTTRHAEDLIDFVNFVEEHDHGLLPTTADQRPADLYIESLRRFLAEAERYAAAGEHGIGEDADELTAKDIANGYREGYQRLHAMVSAVVPALHYLLAVVTGHDAE